MGQPFKFAITVGSYALPHYIIFQILSLRRVFGEIPILISDDRSSESPVIESIADKYGVGYVCSSARRGHFAGDVQTICHAIQFAKQCNAGAAIKISQRLVLVNPIIRELAEGYLARDGIAIALPGTPPRVQICGSKGFLNYRYMTDAMFLRPDRIDAETIRDGYESSWKNSTNKLDCIPEMAFARMVSDGALKGKVVQFEELTAHSPDRHKWFHRRCQSTSFEYGRAAAALGLTGQHWQTGEWGRLDRHYSPRPMA